MPRSMRRRRRAPARRRRRHAPEMPPALFFVCSSAPWRGRRARRRRRCPPPATPRNMRSAELPIFSPAASCCFSMPFAHSVAAARMSAFFPQRVVPHAHVVTRVFMPRRRPPPPPPPGLCRCCSRRDAAMLSPSARRHRRCSIFADCHFACRHRLPTTSRPARSALRRCLFMIDSISPLRRCSSDIFSDSRYDAPLSLRWRAAARSLFLRGENVHAMRMAQRVMAQPGEQVRRRHGSPAQPRRGAP